MPLFPQRTMAPSIEHSDEHRPAVETSCYMYHPCSQLDIEGYEPYALAGARALLRRCNVFAIYTELSTVLSERDVVQHGIDALLDLGYTLRAIDTQRDPKRADFVLKDFQKVGKRRPRPGSLSVVSRRATERPTLLRAL